MELSDSVRIIISKILMFIFDLLLSKAEASEPLGVLSSDNTGYNRGLLEKELAFDEGKRLNPYKDSMGHWTVGIGHFITKKERVRSISEQECHQLFQRDLAIAERNLSQIFPAWKQLDDVRQRALLNLSFNLGNKLSQFVTFLTFMKRREFVSAGNALKKSRWYRQVGKRAQRIILMIQEASARGYPQ